MDNSHKTKIKKTPSWVYYAIILTLVGILLVAAGASSREAIMRDIITTVGAILALFGIWIISKGNTFYGSVELVFGAVCIVFAWTNLSFVAFILLGVLMFGYCLSNIIQRKKYLITHIIGLMASGIVIAMASGVHIGWETGVLDALFYASGSLFIVEGVLSAILYLVHDYKEKKANPSKDSLTDLEKACDFLKKTGTYYLATVDQEGNPHVRPFGTAHIYQGRLYMETGLKKEVAKQMLAHPEVEISGMYLDKWIRLKGKVALDESQDAQKSLLDAYPSLKKMYAVGDGNTAVFYFTEAEGEICSFKDPKEALKF